MTEKENNKWDFMVHMKSACELDISKSTVAIYARSDGTTTPELLGTGVLLTVAGEYFLTTAYHLLAKAKNASHSLWVATAAKGGMLQALSGLPYVSIDDPLDVSVMKLPAEVAKALEGRRFLELADLDPGDAQHTGSCYLVMGFPIDNSSADGQELYSVAQPYITVTYGGESGPVKRSELSKQIVLAFSHTGNIDEKNRNAEIYRVTGFSGGGAWRLAEAGTHIPNWKPECKRLVAIMHTKDCATNAFIGTRVGCILHLMAKNWPHLRDAIANSFGVICWLE